MKSIEIKSQVEYDNLLNNGLSEETKVIIDGNLEEIKELPNAFYYIIGNSIIKEIKGNCTIQYASGNCTIQSAYENCTIQYAFGNCTIQRAYGNCTIQSAFGNCTIQSAFGNCTIQYAFGNCTIQSAFGNCTIQYASGNCTIQSAYENCTIQYAYGNCTIQRVSGNCTIQRAYGNCIIQYAYGNCTIQSASGGYCTIQRAYGNCTIQRVSGNCTIQSAYGNCIIRIYENTVKINSVIQSVILIYQDCKAKNIKHKYLIETKTEKITKKIFLDIYKKNMIDKKHIKLYKSVKSDMTDFYTGKIKYEGIVICPEYNSDKNIQCGQGLHLSPTPEMALSYHSGILLECKVNIKDFVIYSKNITKVRCKKIEVLGLYNAKK